MSEGNLAATGLSFCSDKASPYDPPEQLTDEELKKLAVYYNKFKVLGMPSPFTVNRFGTLLEYTGQVERVAIPSFIKAIHTAAFEGNRAIREVRLPEGLKIIPTFCFKDCGNLHTLVLPDSLELVGRMAFYGCDALRSRIEYGDRLWALVAAHMAGGLYGQCENRPVLPDTASFYIVGDGFVHIGKGLRYLQKAPVSPRALQDNAEFRSGGKTSPIGFEYHGTLDYYEALSRETDMPIIPLNTGFDGFREAFPKYRDMWNGFRGAILAEGFTEIPTGAFVGLEGLRAVRLPSTLKTIRAGAFASCTDLEYIDLFPGLEIEPGAFEDCPHIVWVGPEELRGGRAWPDQAEKRALLRTLYDALTGLDTLDDTPELRYLKVLIPELRISDGTREIQDAVDLQKELCERLKKARRIKPQKSFSYIPQLISIRDVRLHDAIRAAIRYELKYMRR